MQTLNLFAAVSGLVSLTSSSGMGFWDYLVWPLGQIFRFCYWLIPSFSIAVLLFAIIFKVALFPLDIKRQRSQAKMLRFQPKINEIQRKYADNREKMNEETQKLYTEEGYNPMSGCLPSLLPLPLFLGLYRVIVRPLTFLGGIAGDVVSRATEILSANVEGLKTSVYNVEIYLHRYICNPETAGWFSELPKEAIEKIQSLDMTLFGLDLTMNVKDPGVSWVYWIFPVITVLASIVSAFIMGRITKKNNEGMAGANTASNPLMVFGLPILTGVITYSFPAGVLLYWIYNSLLALAVNLILNKCWPMQKLVAEYNAEVEARRASGQPVGKASKFREKLLAAQEKNSEQVKRLEEYNEKQAFTKKELERRAIARARERELEEAAKYAETSTPDLIAREEYLRTQSKKKNKAGSKNEGPL